MKYSRVSHQDFSPPHDWLHQAHPWFLRGPVYEDDQYVGSYTRIELFGRIFYKHPLASWLVVPAGETVAEKFLRELRATRKYLGWTLDEWARAAYLHPGYTPDRIGAGELHIFGLPTLTRHDAIDFAWANRLWWNLEHP